MRLRSVMTNLQVKKVPYLPFVSPPHENCVIDPSARTRGIL